MLAAAFGFCWSQAVDAVLRVGLFWGLRPGFRAGLLPGGLLPGAGSTAGARHKGEAQGLQ